MERILTGQVALLRAGPALGIRAIMTIPAYETDIYSDDAIRDPHPHYRAMRDLGPLVYLPMYDLYALPRYADVRNALVKSDRFLSGQGVAGFRWPAHIDVANTLASDEPLHSRFRKVVGAPLAPPALGPLTERIETAAFDLIQRLVRQGEFDGMSSLAQFLPISIVSSLVGLPEKGRERMLDWAAASFDVLGVDNARSAAAMGEVGAMVHYVQTQCSPDTVAPGGWASDIWAAVGEGRLTPQEGGILHIDLLAPSLDTTIFATGHLLNFLGRHPDQWRRIKADPALIPLAIEEAVRLESPIRAFARVANGDQDIDGSVLPDGARVLVMYASANRDERRWQDPDRFWMDRPYLASHLGFGGGRHACVGMHLAKLEIRSLLKAMVALVDEIEVGEPTLRLNNVLRGFASLPTRFTAAA